MAKAISQIKAEDGAETPLLNILNTSDPYVKLYCFVSLQGNLINQIPETEVVSVVEDISAEIRRLHARTKQVVVGQELGGSSATGAWYDDITELRPDPDIEGITEIVSRLPQSIRWRVFELSGDAKYLFTDEYSRRTLLRSSEGVATSPDQLLRPAIGGESTPPDQLLRPSDKDD